MALIWITFPCSPSTETAPPPEWLCHCQGWWKGLFSLSYILAPDHGIFLHWLENAFSPETCPIVLSILSSEFCMATGNKKAFCNHLYRKYPNPVVCVCMASIMGKQELHPGQKSELLQLYYSNCIGYIDQNFRQLKIYFVEQELSKTDFKQSINCWWAKLSAHNLMS